MKFREPMMCFQLVPVFEENFINSLVKQLFIFTYIVYIASFKSKILDNAEHIVSNLKIAQKKSYHFRIDNVFIPF